MIKDVNLRSWSKIKIRRTLKNITFLYFFFISKFKFHVDSFMMICITIPLKIRIYVWNSLAHSTFDLRKYTEVNTPNVRTMYSANERQIK